MRRSAITSICLGLFLTSFASLHAQDSLGVRIGKKVFLDSKTLGEKRELQIATPSYYEDSGDTYPLLILLDGESHFKHVSTMVDFLALNVRIPQMIVVAIPNTDRVRDFMPIHSLTGLTEKVDSALFMTSGGGDNFLKFLKNEVIPYVDKNYRTQPYRILMGHSLGGQFVTYAWQKEPETFQAVIAVSGAFYGKNKNTLRTIPKFISNHPGLKGNMFVAIGDEPLIQPGVDSLTLLLKNSPKSFHWTYKKYAADDHGSVVHLAIHDALRFIYPDWFTNTNDAENIPRYEDVAARFKKMSAEYGYPINVPEMTFAAIGFLHLELNQYDEAINIFNLMTKNFPSSAGAQFCLGLAFKAKKDKNMALRAFEKSLELNPKSSGAKEMVEAMKK